MYSTKDENTEPSGFSDASFITDEITLTFLNLGNRNLIEHLEKVRGN